jgi:MFS family permease
MPADHAVLEAHDVQPALASQSGLDWLNFFLAGVLTGFGPFVAVYLASQHWTNVAIGFVLTVAGLAGLLSQVPSGELLDVVAAKRPLVALGLVMIAAAAMIFALKPSFALVVAAEVLQGISGAFLGPAVAAISLGLVGHNALAERLGRNQRFAAFGGFATAGLMGLLGYFFSNHVIFIASAALAVPALLALGTIRASDIHFNRACSAPPGDYHPARAPRVARSIVGVNYRLLVFAGCITLFQIANASMLPLVGEELGPERKSSLIISALVIVPQIMVALLAPWVGRAAQTWGRRPLLLVGFGALPVRAVCFALTTEPLVFICAQVLDGISGAVVGVLTPLVIADITKGTGRFNLAQGIVGTFSGIGASLSTTASGFVAQSFGGSAGFFAIAIVALAAVGLHWGCMPETKPARSVAQLASGF